MNRDKIKNLIVRFNLKREVSIKNNKEDYICVKMLDYLAF